MDTMQTQTGLVITDGGRVAAGFGPAEAGDCFVRAVAIATGFPYREVYEGVARLSHDIGGKRSARGGVSRKLSRAYLDYLGWRWHPTMQIGSGCTVHLRPDELPPGRLVVNLSKHFCAVIDGVVYDNHDPRREGTRCVYGYWMPPHEGSTCEWGYTITDSPGIWPSRQRRGHG